jgi:hypothetical protein
LVQIMVNRSRIISSATLMIRAAAL